MSTKVPFQRCATARHATKNECQPIEHDRALPNFPALPEPNPPRRATVEDVEDEYQSWHALQDWLPPSDPALLRPVTEFYGGEGVDDTLCLNSISTSVDAIQGTSFPVDEPGEVTDTVEPKPNRNVRRRHSQELQKAKDQKKRDEKRDESSSRAVKRMEKRTQRKTNRSSPQPMDQDIPQLREQWTAECRRSFESQPDRLPPLRKINHRIPLVDESKRHHYRQPRCPEAFREALLTKINRYTAAGWWEPVTTSQAVPMLCVPKSSKNQHELRTVFDLREQNANTHKDLTPMPDQDAIRHAVAKAKYRSKCDISNAYELIRVEPDDVWKTAFSTIYGTFVSNVMQQGDCNAPSTFQRFVTHLFREHIGKFVHVYLDDIFIFSDTIEDHEKHLRIILDILREAEMTLNPKKCDFYSERMDCLGHIIDDQGIHADANKMTQIQEWRTPRNYHDVQRFLGLVQYIQHFLPNVSTFTAPLSSMTQNGHEFQWRPVHEKAFQEIKALASHTPILKPVDPKSPEPIWVICDASTSGVGAVYGQGPKWETCRPAGFMSKKFQEAQYNYRVFEMETLAILEALLKWEDKLLGRKFTVVTDHKALEFFSKQRKLSGRQARWAEYLSRFDFEIQYVQGKDNVVADSLSRYYKSDTLDEKHPGHVYVSADLRLDPNGDDLPPGYDPQLRRAQIDVEEPEVSPTLPPQALLVGETTPEATEINEAEAIALPQIMGNTDGFLESVRSGYRRDTLFSKILDQPSHFPNFRWENGLLYFYREEALPVLCIPRSVHRRRNLTEIVLSQAHETLGHAGTERTAKYVRRFYWWSTLSKDVEKLCRSCGTCQAVKPSTQLPMGLLHTLPVPGQPWESIAMDFIGPLPPSPTGENFLWVIIDRMTSLVHLVPIKTSTDAAELADRYIREVVRLHGVAKSIVSDRDPRFTSKFWAEVNRILGTQLLMSTAFHPQTDGATERANRTINAILRAVVNPDQSDWMEKVPMVEFAINSSVNKSTGCAPFDLTYGYIPTLRGLLDKVPTAVKPGVREFAYRSRQHVAEAHDSIIAARIRQTFHANKRRREEPLYSPGDRVWLSTENLSMPKGRVRKLMPKFIGPFMILRADHRHSNYMLELPMEMLERRINPTFHSSLLRPFEPNDDKRFPHRDVSFAYDYGTPNDDEWWVDEILAHRWVGKRVEFNVLWSLGDSTWEPLSACNELAALDDYLQLLGVEEWKDLPKRRPKDGLRPLVTGTRRSPRRVQH